MWISSRYCVDTRLNDWNTTLIQRWSIPLPMLSPIGGWALKIMSTRSIGWRARVVYLRLCLIRKYIISWFYTCKVRLVHGIWVVILQSCNNHGLKKNRGPFSLFFTPIYCIVVFTSQRRWQITDWVQPKTSPFSTRHIHSMNYKVLSKLSQPIPLLFSYLNSARHNSVIELRLALKVF